MANKVLSEPIAILGAGVAGLIDAYVLLQDGFTNVTVITRDRSVGGTWSRDRVYPGLCINKYVLLHHSRGAINNLLKCPWGIPLLGAPDGPAGGRKKNRRTHHRNGHV